MPRLLLPCILLLTLGSAAFGADRQTKLTSAATEIDRLIDARLQTAGVTAAKRSEDAEFCRRVWLDLAGVAPPVSDLREFLADESPNKREVLIDRLLSSSQHASHMATRWNSILLPPDAQSQPEQQQSVIALQRWLRDQFRDNVPYDYLVAGFLTAGGTSDSGPAVFYTSRELEPEKLAAATD